MPPLCGTGCTLLLLAGCTHAASRPPGATVSWPADTPVVHVEMLPDGEVTEIARKPAASLGVIGCDVTAFGAAGNVRMPSELAGVLGACWVDGVFVPWDDEVCLLGGHIARGEHHLQVDGGFCYVPTRGAWRTVRLDRVPSGLGDAETLSSRCRSVQTPDGRALRCEVRTGGGTVSVPGANSVEHMPEAYSTETFRLVGLR